MWELVSNDKLPNDCELPLEWCYMWLISGRAYTRVCNVQFANNSIDMDALFEGDEVYEVNGLLTNT